VRRIWARPWHSKHSSGGLADRAGLRANLAIHGKCVTISSPTGSPRASWTINACRRPAKRLPGGFFGRPSATCGATSFWRPSRFLRLACESDLAEPQRSKAQQLLLRVERLKTLCHLPTAIMAATSESWRAGPPGQNPSDNRYPVFRARARQAFGETLPSITFYLFDERPAYERLLHQYDRRPGIHRTSRNGDLQHRVVLPVLSRRKGKSATRSQRTLCPRPARVWPRIVQHDLCDLYQDRVPQWLNEGLADAFARSIRTILMPTLHASSRRRRRAARPDLR